MSRFISSEEALSISSIEELEKKIKFIHFASISKKINSSDSLTILTQDVFGEGIAERCYRLLNKSPKCIKCGKDVKFINAKKGFWDYCSKSCAHADEQYLDRIQSKYKQTCIEKYGVDSYLKSTEFKSYERSNNSPEAVLKRKQTNLEKFGATTPYGNFDIAAKGALSKQHSTAAKKNELIKHQFEYVDNREPNIYEDRLFRHIACGNEFLHNWATLQRDPICRNCAPMQKGSSDYEQDIETFIRTVTSLELFRNKRFYFDGRRYHEADLFIPACKLIIEFNGIYWHSELFKDPYYHKKKYDFFVKMGYQVFNIWESDWVFKQEIIKSMIRYKLRCVEDYYDARKCSLSFEVEYVKVKAFLDSNHLNGCARFTKSVCLIYDNEILSVCTFALKRYGKHDNSFELIRFASKLNCVVRGALSRMITSFQKTVKQKIVTYADLSNGAGTVYLASGFAYKHTSKPGYRYFYLSERFPTLYHRSVFMRKKMLLLLNRDDAGESEAELAKELGLVKIWDCGHAYYEKEFI